MSAPLKLGLAGLGTVGQGVSDLLAANGTLIAQRTGRALEIAAIAARDKAKPRTHTLPDVPWHADAVALAASDDVDVVVELIGGSNGVALDLVAAALKAGKHVVTANKALIAHHGLALAKLAEENGVQLAFDAAVAGGIPILKTVREGLAANRADRVYGILNGTCNYILTEMEATGAEFADVLAEAQALGYAEADPSFDVDGVDAAHKLAILASLAFGSEIDFGSVSIEGIRRIGALDIERAAELGYRIKLLGIARQVAEGVEQRVEPVMVPLSTPIAAVGDVYNAVVVDGDQVGRSVSEGRGAGAGPTASAVVADLIDIASGRTNHPFGVPVAALVPARAAPSAAHVGRYYVRLDVLDRQGVLADVSAILRDEAVSIESLIQRGRAPDEPVSVALVSHEVVETRMTAALDRIGRLEAVLEPPHMIRIENL